MRHLFIFTITPVQSFIAEARKVSDLAAGSHLLSELIGDAMQYLIDRNISSEEDIIFPSRTIESKPNRFLAYINTNDAQQLGIGLEAYIREEVFLKEAKKKLASYFPEHLDAALNQLEDALKIYWVAIPATADYTVDNEHIERLLGGIKKYRHFKQFEEVGRKCVINGEYNVTIFKKPESGKTPSWLEYTPNVQVYNFGDNKPSLKQLSPGEGLCTMNFYKRICLPKTERDFDATCQIAYLDAVTMIEDGSLAKKQMEQLQNFDEQYIYSDAIVNNTKDRVEIERLQRSLSGYFKAKKLKVAKYYAVLVFDADHMGKWLSGEYLANRKEDQLKFQKRLSVLFGDFARFARDYVDGNEDDLIVKKGRTIYAGGDDFLGLINLSYLFDVLTTLHHEFHRMIWENGLTKEFTFKTSTEYMTFSAGVAIAHYKTPLSYVLNEARSAEKNAKHKNGGNRNALAITVLKRSGEIHKSVFNWKDSSGGFLLDNLAAITRTLNEKTSSNKFITAFSEEFLPVINDSNFGYYSNLLEIEIGRLLKDNQVLFIKEHVSTLLKAFLEKRGRLQDFIFLLNISDFISREIGQNLPAYASH